MPEGEEEEEEDEGEEVLEGEEEDVEEIVVGEAEEVDTVVSNFSFNSTPIFSQKFSKNSLHFMIIIFFKKNVLPLISFQEVPAALIQQLGANLAKQREHMTALAQLHVQYDRTYRDLMKCLATEQEPSTTTTTTTTTASSTTTTTKRRGTPASATATTTTVTMTGTRPTPTVTTTSGISTTQTSKPRGTDTRRQTVKKGDDNLYTCERCNKKFTTKAGIDSHWKSHTGESLKCPKCGKAYLHRGALHDHITSGCGTKYRCDICDKAVQKMSLLKEHKDTHCTTSAWMCPEADCPDPMVRQKSHFKAHIKIHHTTRLGDPTLKPIRNPDAQFFTRAEWYQKKGLTDPKAPPPT